MLRRVLRRGIPSDVPDLGRAFQGAVGSAGADADGACRMIEMQEKTTRATKRGTGGRKRIRRCGRTKIKTRPPADESNYLKLKMQCSFSKGPDGRHSGMRW